jgi:hypothetical protein
MTGRSRRAWLVVALGLVLAGCGDSGGVDEWSTTPTAAQLPDQPPDQPPGPPLATTAAPGGAVPTVEELRGRMVWEGTFTIALEVWDYCNGSGQLARSKSYTRTESFSFSTDPPVDYGPAARETNPFFVSAGTDPDRGGPVGLALQSTGVVALPGQEDDPYVLQFWELDYDDGRLTGHLAEDGRELGLAFNGFQDQDLLVTCQPQLGSIVRTYPMQEGTTIDATIRADRVNVVITGQSYDGQRRFHVDAQAVRTG